MVSSNEHVYTMDDLINYSHRLHFNTVVDIIANSIAAFVVLKYSTKAMGVYKYFIIAPYMMLPSSVLCGASFIAFKAGIFWGRYFLYFIMHITLSCVGWSIVFSVIYQYCTLIGKVEFFHKPRGIIVVALTMILYSMPSYSILVMGFRPKASAEYIRTNYNNSYEVYINAPCYATIMDVYGMSYHIALMTQILLVYVIGISVAFKINRKLAEMKIILSPSTLKVKKQLLLSLYIQAAVPLGCIIIPGVFISISMLLKLTYSNVISDYGLPVLALHSLFNSISVLTVITPYRRAMRSGFRYIFPSKNQTTRIVTIDQSSRSLTFTTDRRLTRPNI